MIAKPTSPTLAIAHLEQRSDAKPREGLQASYLRCHLPRAHHHSSKSSYGVPVLAIPKPTYPHAALWKKSFTPSASESAPSMSPLRPLSHLAEFVCDLADEPIARAFETPGADISADQFHGLVRV